MIAFKTFIRSALVFALGICFLNQTASAQQKHRVIILTDIEADPDDTQSLVRLLLYSNEIDIEGIVATTSCWLTESVHPESIHKVLNAYEKAQPNLLKHQSGYPSAADLGSIVKSGLPIYGMKGVGEGHDSEGSEWILHMLEKDDDRPLWISTWGGVNTLAQTLFRIRESKSKREADGLIAKLRVYTISDQDDSGLWIRNNFPDLFYIVTPGDDYGNSTWNAIMSSNMPGVDHTTISNQWLADNIQQDHGPFGAQYPDVAWGMEGDTPAFLSLIPNGLNYPEKPNWGGWGGRYEKYLPDFSKVQKGPSIVELGPETREIWTNANDTFTPYVYNAYGRNLRKDTIEHSGFKETLWRWRDDFQHDFAARMDWTISDYENANHPPKPRLTHPEEITVKSGENFMLDAFDTTDPDGDSFTFLWFHYPEPGTYAEVIPVNGAENVHKVYFTAPEVTREETAHFILKVTDKGTPALTRYKRVIVTIKP